MRDSVTLTDLQLAIVRILWTKGASTVLEVQEGLLPERSLAQTTVATLLTRLEKRGVVRHQMVGRQFRYEALVTEPDVRQQAFGRQERRSSYRVHATPPPERRDAWPEPRL